MTEISTKISSNRLRPQTIPEQLADAIGKSIISGDYEDGMRLVEQDLAEQFDVSRGPVREALRLLDRRGLVRHLPRRGAYVRQYSLDDIADMFNVRTALLGLAARQAAIHMDPDFLETLRRQVARLQHIANADLAEIDSVQFGTETTKAVQSLIRGCGNLQLAQMVLELSENSAWFVVWRRPMRLPDGEQTRRRRIATLVNKTLEAVEKHDPDRAEACLRTAMEISRDFVIESLSMDRNETADTSRLFRTANAD